jgi:hypothetical protein
MTKDTLCNYSPSREIRFPARVAPSSGHGVPAKEWDVTQDAPATSQNNRYGLCALIMLQNGMDERHGIPKKATYCIGCMLGFVGGNLAICLLAILVIVTVPLPIILF